jgi:hypothetical protein
MEPTMQQKAVYRPPLSFEKREGLIIVTHSSPGRTAVHLSVACRHAPDEEVFIGTIFGAGGEDGRRQPVDPKVIERAKRRIHDVLNGLLTGEGDQ